DGRLLEADGGVAGPRLAGADGHPPVAEAAHDLVLGSQEAPAERGVGAHLEALAVGRQRVVRALEDAVEVLVGGGAHAAVRREVEARVHPTCARDERHAAEAARVLERDDVRGPRLPPARFRGGAEGRVTVVVDLLRAEGEERERPRPETAAALDLERGRAEGLLVKRERLLLE